MVIFYYKDTGMIKAVENNVMTPTSPADKKTVADKVKYYNSIGLKFVSVPYELGAAIMNYKVLMNEAGEFTALYPIQEGDLD